MFYVPMNSEYYRMRNIKAGTTSTKYRARAGYIFAITLPICIILGLVAALAVSALTATESTQNTVLFGVQFKDFMMFLLIGLGGGFLLGLIVGLISKANSWAEDVTRHATGEEYFAPVRSRLGQVRSIICEFRAFVVDNYAQTFLGEREDATWKIGRFFLTDSTLEFYDGNYRSGYRNFLINLHDICYVSRRSRRVIIYTRSGKYRIHVPIGTSADIRRELLTAMHRGTRSIHSVYWG